MERYVSTFNHEQLARELRYFLLSLLPPILGRRSWEFRPPGSSNPPSSTRRVAGRLHPAASAGGSESKPVDCPHSRSDLRPTGSDSVWSAINEAEREAIEGGIDTDAGKDLRVLCRGSSFRNAIWPPCADTRSAPRNKVVRASPGTSTKTSRGRRCTPTFPGSSASRNPGLRKANRITRVAVDSPPVRSDRKSRCTLPVGETRGSLKPKGFKSGPKMARYFLRAPSRRNQSES